MTQRNIKVLHPTSAWGGGHVQTCINICQGMVAHGARAKMYLNRSRVPMGALAHSVSIPGAISRYGLTRFEPWARQLTERRFLAELEPDDIAHLWPGVSLKTYREVHRRQVPIIMEGINTRMAAARMVLDAAYDAVDQPRAHGITQARIDEEEEMLSMASHFFSPSPGVDMALTQDGSSFQGKIFHSSYGVWADAAAQYPRPDPDPKRVLRFIFVGSVCIRKGVHLLLQAWEQAEIPNVELVLCGGIEPAISEICARQLARHDVHALGHVTGVFNEFAKSDVFVMPSLEEGDPQVTYEAASFGLPIMGSFMGGGRLRDRTDAVLAIDPVDRDDFAAKLHQIATNSALRQDHAHRAKQAVSQFDWGAVGSERVHLLDTCFDGAVSNGQG